MWNCFSDISFGMCLNLMSWVQQEHNAAVVASLRSLGCQLAPLAARPGRAGSLRRLHYDDDHYCPYAEITGVMAAALNLKN